jgi:exportin-1
VLYDFLAIFPRQISLKQVYEQGSPDDCLFINRLALFLVTYLKSYIYLFYLPDGNISHEAVVLEALFFLLRISEVEDDDGDIFKTCLEFWVQFAKDLYTSDMQWKQQSGIDINSAGLTNSDGLFVPSVNVPNPNNSHGPRVAIFDSILHSLRVIVIDRMAKPEEVIIVEDDNGEIVREQTKDTEVLVQYKTMRECIVYLANLNYDNTEAIMLEKLDRQSNGGFSWNGLNTLCWAIGSISGAMGELDEKRYVF